MEVTAVVERDPGLVREIWVRASGANFRRPPSRLDEAISRVGFTELWRVTMQMAVQSPVFRAGRYQAEAELIHAHGTMCAEVAAQIAREPRGTAYLAGLLHDVGKLVIFRAAGGLKDPPSPVLIARILQNHHSTIGMMAARSWNLGPEIEQAIGFHHHPPFTALNKPGPLGPTAMAEAALQIAAAERSQGKNDSGILDLAGEPIHSPVPVPDFVELPEELREAVLTAHRLMDARVKAESTGKKGKK
jgi:putative nucleotidyltransferase with HDIG domain